jgi:Tol biopolymer transport system component
VRLSRYGTVLEAMAGKTKLLGLALCLVGLGSATGADGAAEAELPGQMALAGRGIDLLDPGTGEIRPVVESGTGPAFFPSGEGIAYVRAGGCFPSGGPEGCYTEYSVFEKSLSDSDPAAPGRQVLGWTDFFVRAVSVAPNKRLVFSAKPGPGPGEKPYGNGIEIYSIAWDGSDLRRLTDNDVFDNDPAVSPDGRYVAFARRVHGRGQIFSMRIDGTHVRRLTRDKRRNRLPAWAPGGHRLAFISAHAQSLKREIFTVSAQGGRQRRLTHNEATETVPVYSPDGNWIAFVREGAIWAMAADGSSARPLVPSSGIAGYHGLDWAPAAP